MRRLVAAALAALLTAAASGAGAAPAPSAGIGRLAELATPLPLPYDPAADAQAQVALARARARASGKLLLIDLGGNWCGDCRILAAVMRLPAIAAFVDAHYEVVTVDVGRMDRNLDIPARWGVGRLAGVPSLLVIDGRDRLVDAGHVEALADARSMTPQALADWLASWTD
jgi:thiol-disulfide isomerase/thioredoxin